MVPDDLDDEPNQGQRADDRRERPDNVKDRTDHDRPQHLHELKQCHVSLLLSGHYEHNIILINKCQYVDDCLKL